jgi:hypothetical protein
MTYLEICAECGMAVAWPAELASIKRLSWRGES